METAIRVNQLSKKYKLYNKPSDRLREVLGRKVPVREHYALQKVSFSVKKGETVGIIGTNGSGKSTVLKIITGVVTPTEGEVEVNGKISALLELGAGFNMEYTGIENVYLNGTMIGFSREEIDARLADILEFADIGDFVYQPVKTYSSGMFVRLAFAVAINIDPDILIVDEALSVGDVFFQAKCYHKFEEFKKMGRTIVFVSHDLNSISKYCDRVILLNKGVILNEGSPKEMVDLYKQVLVKQNHPDNTQNTREKEGPVSGAIVQNPDYLEYGDGKARITEFSIEDAGGVQTNTVRKMEEFTVRLKVKFSADVTDPIYAFSIKDLRGTEITGSNTLVEKIPVKNHHAGEEQTIEFTQLCSLQGGEYLLSFGCTGYTDGEFAVHHRLYDICNLTVVSSKDTVGFYDIGSRIMLK